MLKLSVDQAKLELRDRPDSASGVLECAAPPPNSKIFFEEK